MEKKLTYQINNTKPAASQEKEKIFVPTPVLADLPPLSLYIHFPWCIKKCPYCDFNSHQIRNNLIPEELYVESIITDIKIALPSIQGRQIQSIFLGGGTPSLLSIRSFEKLMSAVQSLLPVNKNAEITMEANPGTIDQTRFKAFHDNGINRLSLGIQSFSDEKLIALGRIHNSENAKRAIDIAMNIYNNINLDIMYALPSQTIRDFQSDIVTALSYKTQHLSLYHLTIEPNTFFSYKTPTLPTDEKIHIMEEIIMAYTSHSGFFNYEISAFARKNWQCKHNCNYWKFGDYLGVGAGAHSKISMANNTGEITIIREIRWKHPDKYINFALKKQPIEIRKIVKPSDLPFEYMLNALRLSEGFSPGDFVKKTGVSYATILPIIEEAIANGLLMRIWENTSSSFSTKKKRPGFKTERITPTSHGKRFLNDLQQMFLVNTSS